MADVEEIEKVRQAIMRYRELLNVMRERFEDGERAYAKLFAEFSPDDMANTKEKDLQWQLAERMVADTAPLRRAVGAMHFHARDLGRGFEELHGIVSSETRNPIS